MTWLKDSGIQPDDLDRTIRNARGVEEKHLVYITDVYEFGYVLINLAAESESVL